VAAVGYDVDGTLFPTWGSGGIVMTQAPGFAGQIVMDAFATSDNGQVTAIGWVSP